MIWFHIYNVSGMTRAGLEPRTSRSQNFQTLHVKLQQRQQLNNLLIARHLRRGLLSLFQSQLDVYTALVDRRVVVMTAGEYLDVF